MISENNVLCKAEIENFKVKNGKLTIQISVEDVNKVDLAKLTEMSENGVMLGLKSVQTKLPIDEKEK